MRYHGKHERKLHRWGRFLLRLLLVLALVMFGCNAGLGFYLNAKAIKLVPLYVVPIIQSTMVFFSILWGILFFHETITGYTIGGTLLFVAGILIVQLKSRQAAAEG